MELVEDVIGWSDGFALTNEDLFKEVATLRDTCDTPEELRDEIAYLLKFVYPWSGFEVYELF